MLHDSLNRPKWTALTPAHVTLALLAVLTCLNYSLMTTDNPYAYETNVHEFPHDFDTTVDDIMGNYSVVSNDRARPVV
jgi:hypothetical protein